MRLHSYRVARDFGFALNPFHNFCTLATCKPVIRRTAQIDDWIVGTGSRQNSRENHIVYAMRVTEILTFDKYRSDPRFHCKKPVLTGSLKYAYGDNIYHRDVHTNSWIQEDSHHSHADGTPNQKNIHRDTSSTDRVLVSTEFYYWGGDGPQIPIEFLGPKGSDIRAPSQGHRNAFSDSFIQRFLGWIESNYCSNRCYGRPLDWGR